MKRILVVDDDEANREAITGLLQQEGYEAVPLGDPAQVEAALQVHRPALVVLDYMMPGRSGGDVAAALDAIHDATPRLFVTALSVSLDSLRGHALLRKPFGADELLRAVARIIGPPEG